MSKTVSRCFATLLILGLLSVRAGVVTAAVPPRDIDQLRQADLIVRLALTTGSTCIEMGEGLFGFRRLIVTQSVWVRCRESVWIELSQLRLSVMSVRGKCMLS